MTTTTPITSTKRLAILRHLAGGKSLDVTATIVGLDRDTVLDVASHHGYPDTDKLAWAADILAKKVDDETTAGTVKTGPLQEGVRLSGASKPRPVPAAPHRPVAVDSTPAAAGPSPHHTVIDTGLQHPSKRIRNAAAKVLADLDRLRQLLAEDEEKNAARRRADAEKEAARAKIAQLEAALAKEKAKLRKPATTKPATTAKKSTAPKGEYPCRNDGCDEVITTPQGRGLHERQHCPHRTQAAS